MYVVHCAEHWCVGWFQGLEGKMRRAVLPVWVMCVIVHLLCFELQCNRNEPNILQEKKGVAPVCILGQSVSQ
jgi:hypothetical protein